MLLDALCIDQRNNDEETNLSIYLRIVFNVIFLVASFGYVLPMLISYPDTILVIAGIAYAVLLVPGVVYYANKNYVSSLFKSHKGNI